MQNIPIPKLAASRHHDENNGPMTFAEWKAQRTAAAQALYNALPGPVDPPNVFEVHPYRHFQDNMPLRPACYLIGTAPPCSYLRENVPAMPAVYHGQIAIDGAHVGAAPDLSFYHGNQNSLWSALGFARETPEHVLEELRERNIRYDDILYSWSRMDFSSTMDQHLTDIVPNVDLLQDIWEREDRPFLWFTNSGVFNQGGVCLHVNQNDHGTPGRVMAHGQNVKAYNVFLRAWQEFGGRIWLRRSADQEWMEVSLANSMDIQANFCHRLRHELRIEWKREVREYPVLSGPSPAGGAAMQLVHHPLYQAWAAEQTPLPQFPTTAFKTHVYDIFLQWIQEHPANV